MAQEISAHAVAIEGLREDRKRQNGTLERLEDKLDALIFKILAALCAFMLASGGWVVVLLTSKH
jgi:hypothetical protein